MLARRSLLLGLGTGLGSLLLSPGVDAGSARALGLRELLLRSRHAFVATSQDARSRWEEHAGGRRIVTYTRLVVTQSVDGRPPTATEMEVRTLGGRVGHLAQMVHGEAQLRSGAASLLFVDAGDDRVWRVTGMAQGHYPLTLDASGVRRLMRSPDLPRLSQWEGAAVRLLPGRSVPEAEQLVAGELAGGSRKETDD